jgi:hypothetical protein
VLPGGTNVPLDARDSHKLSHPSIVEGPRGCQRAGEKMGIPACWKSPGYWHLDMLLIILPCFGKDVFIVQNLIHGSAAAGLGDGHQCRTVAGEAEAETEGSR